jgi:hypothetical protein
MKEESNHERGEKYLFGHWQIVREFDNKLVWARLRIHGLRQNLEVTGQGVSVTI